MACWFKGTALNVSILPDRLEALRNSKIFEKMLKTGEEITNSLSLRQCGFLSPNASQNLRFPKSLKCRQRFVSENYLAAGCSRSQVQRSSGYRRTFSPLCSGSPSLHHSGVVCLEKTAPYKELDW